MDNLKSYRVICPVHGDIGGNGFASVITFTFDGKETIVCSECIRDLLLKHIQPCKKESTDD